MAADDLHQNDNPRTPATGLARAWTELCADFTMAREDAREDVLSDEEIMLLGGAQCEASWRLLAAPAPDAAALAYKLEVFRDEQVYCLVDDTVHEVLKCMIKDALVLVLRES